jgi:hypothetical protein
VLEDIKGASRTVAGIAWKICICQLKLGLPGYQTDWLKTCGIDELFD